MPLNEIGGNSSSRDVKSRHTKTHPIHCSLVYLFPDSALTFLDSTTSVSQIHTVPGFRHRPNPSLTVSSDLNPPAATGTAMGTTPNSGNDKETNTDTIKGTAVSARSVSVSSASAMSESSSSNSPAAARPPPSDKTTVNTMKTAATTDDFKPDAVVVQPSNTIDVAVKKTGGLLLESFKPCLSDNQPPPQNKDKTTTTTLVAREELGVANDAVHDDEKNVASHKQSIAGHGEEDRIAAAAARRGRVTASIPMIHNLDGTAPAPAAVDASSVRKTNTDHNAAGVKAIGVMDQHSKNPVAMSKNAAASNSVEDEIPWTAKQHRDFVAALFDVGLKECSPSVIIENMRKKSRYITRERTKSHLQKYRQTKDKSKEDFLKEYDGVLSAAKSAKNSSTNQDGTPPIPAALISYALKGKPPENLIGGEAAALLSFSVLNNCDMEHGPYQIPFEALPEFFPKLTKRESKSSLGKSLTQVKGMLQSMTDVLLKARHGIMDTTPKGEGYSSSSEEEEDWDDEEEEEQGEGRPGGSYVHKASPSTISSVGSFSGIRPPAGRGPHGYPPNPYPFRTQPQIPLFGALPPGHGSFPPPHPYFGTMPPMPHAPYPPAPHHFGHPMYHGHPGGPMPHPHPSYSMPPSYSAPVPNYDPSTGPYLHYSQAPPPEQTKSEPTNATLKSFVQPDQTISAKSTLPLDSSPPPPSPASSRVVTGRRDDSLDRDSDRVARSTPDVRTVSKHPADEARQLPGRFGPKKAPPPPPLETQPDISSVFDPPSADLAMPIKSRRHRSSGHDDVDQSRSRRKRSRSSAAFSRGSHKMVKPSEAVLGSRYTSSGLVEYHARDGSSPLKFRRQPEDMQPPPPQQPPSSSSWLGTDDRRLSPEDMFLDGAVGVGDSSPALHSPSKLSLGSRTSSSSRALNRQTFWEPLAIDVHDHHCYSQQPDSRPDHPVTLHPEYNPDYSYDHHVNEGHAHHRDGGYHHDPTVMDRGDGDHDLLHRPNSHGSNPSNKDGTTEFSQQFF